MVRRILAAHRAATCASLIGNSGGPARAASRPTSSTTPSACRPSPTSSRSWRSRAGTRARRSAPRPSPRAWRRSPTCKPGMVLEGVVTNVAAFGAFVDVGVHQDGLVHVSAMSQTFVKDPRDVVKPGDVVRVKVLDVDVPRKRISLTLRLEDEVGSEPRPSGGAERGGPGRGTPRGGQPRQGRGGQQSRSGRGDVGGGAMADALRRAGLIYRSRRRPSGPSVPAAAGRDGVDRARCRRGAVAARRRHDDTVAPPVGSGRSCRPARWYRPPPRRVIGQPNRRPAPAARISGQPPDHPKSRSTAQKAPAES